MKLGFVYSWECVDAHGRKKWAMQSKNLIPNVGRDYILNAALNGGVQFSTWYIGLYEANRTPIATDTMASFIADCQEITTYTSTGGLRLELQDAPLSDGIWSNATSPAEFTFTATKTVRGGFISSNAVQGATAGLLLSAVQNSSPKVVENGEILRVVAGLTLLT